MLQKKLNQSASRRIHRDIKDYYWESERELLQKLWESFIVNIAHYHNDALHVLAISFKMWPRSSRVLFVSPSYTSSSSTSKRMSIAGLTIPWHWRPMLHKYKICCTLFFVCVCVRVADRRDDLNIVQRTKPASSALNAASEAAPELNLRHVFKCVRCPRVLYIVSNEFLFVLRAR